MESEETMVSSEGSSLQDRRSVQPILIWLIASVVSTGAVAVAAANAPPRIRLIGLFPVAFGLLVGWIVTWLRNPFDARPGRLTTTIAAVVLALCGWIGAIWESYRLDKAMFLASPQDRMAAQMMQEFEKQSGAPQGPTVNPLREMSFPEFLARRLKQLGNWPSPWPECFWVGELLATATLAGYLAGRVTRLEKAEVGS